MAWTEQYGGESGNVRTWNPSTPAPFWVETPGFETHGESQSYTPTSYFDPRGGQAATFQAPIVGYDPGSGENPSHTPIFGDPRPQGQIVGVNDFNDLNSGFWQNRYDPSQTHWTEAFQDMQNFSGLHPYFLQQALNTGFLNRFPSYNDPDDWQRVQQYLPADGYERGSAAEWVARNVREGQAADDAHTQGQHLQLARLVAMAFGGYMGMGQGAATTAGTEAGAGATTAGAASSTSAGAGGEFVGGLNPGVTGNPGLNVATTGSPGVNPALASAPGSAGSLSPGFFPSENIAPFEAPTFDPSLTRFGAQQTFMNEAFPTEFTGGLNPNVTGNPGFSGNVTGSPGIQSPVINQNPSWWDQLDWRRRLQLGKLGLQGYSTMQAFRGSRDMRRLAEQAANQQPQVIDPLGYGERAPHLARLNALAANPRLLEDSPGYKASMLGVERKMASQGYLGSGNMMRALAENSGNMYNQEIARLSGLAGGNLPLSVSRPDMSAAIAAMQGKTNMRGAGLATAAFGLSALSEFV